MINQTTNSDHPVDDRYVNKDGYSMRHTKCGTTLLLKTNLGRVPFCEKCQCYVTKPTDYEKFIP